MIFWIDRIQVPICLSKKENLYVQREYDKAFMTPENAETLFDNIVQEEAERLSPYVTIFQLIAQVGSDDTQRAVITRAVINVGEVTVKHFGDNLALAQRYDTQSSERKTMKVSFSFSWYTDGDYSVRVGELQECFKRFPLDCLQEIIWHGDKQDDIGSLNVTFESDDRQRCLRAIRDLLNRLSVSMSISFTHNYLVEDLYKIFDDAAEQLKPLWDKPQSCFIRADLSGNYEGTEVTIDIIE